MFSRLYLLFIAMGLSASTAFSANSVIKLSEARTKLTFPEYSPQERQLLADQADLLLRQLYVNREQKISQFGPSVDPLPRLDKIRRQAKSMSDEALHNSLSAVFTDLHDLHTNYVFPSPKACSLTFVPLRFASVSDSGRMITAVSARIKLQGSLADGIEVGDELLAVNGDSVETALKQLGGLSGGANGDAMKARAIEMLSFRSGASQNFPDQDSVVFRFKGKEGEYEKEIPWMTLVDEECLQGPDNRRRPRMDLGVAEDDFQKKFNRIFDVEKLPSDLPQDFERPSALSEIFETSLLTTPLGKLGYVRLKSFYWDSPSLDVETVVDGLRRSVEEKLVGAIGIVIDVRGNPGGLITFSEKIIQLFSAREVQPTTVRMLANELNEEIFVRANGGENRWSEAVRNAIAKNNEYGGPIAITPSHEANDLGQIWFRPVAVLTDATCYSACDLFAAGMQDSGAGVIIGLHKGTGGGGANVMEQSTFQAIFGSSAENPFKTLPGGQSMRVSWRQVLRVGKNEGKLIEGEGVLSDVIISPSRSDLGGEPRELMRQIRNVVEGLGPKYKSGLAVRRGGTVVLNNNTSARWQERTWGVDTIDLLVGGERVDGVTLTATEQEREIELAIESLRGNWTDEPVVIVGKLEGKQVFRSVRELKWRGDYLTVPEAGVRSSFGTGRMDPFHTVLVHGPKNSGWQLSRDKLRVGVGPKYSSSVHTRAFIPLKIEGERVNVTFDLKLMAESPYDTLRIFLLNPDTGEVAYIFAGSEYPSSEGLTFPLPIEWSRADAVFEFQSDENWNMEGPEIGNLVITRK